MSGAPNHDSAYSDPLLYRGNVTLQTTVQGVTCTLHDLLGHPYFSRAPHSPALATSTGAGTNYTLPTAITSNGDSNSTVAVSYSAFLTPSGFAGPNGANANVTYDLYGRAATSQSPDGAVTNYTYSLGAAPLTQLAVIAAPNNPYGPYGFNSYRWTLTTVDGLGRAVKVQTGPGQTPGNARPRPIRSTGRARVRPQERLSKYRSRSRWEVRFIGQPTPTMQLGERYPYSCRMERVHRTTPIRATPRRQPTRRERRKRRQWMSRDGPVLLGQLVVDVYH